VALRLRTDGLLYAELRPFRREVRFLENVSPEGVEALLAGNDGIAWPVFVDGPRGSFRQTGQWPWFPEHRKWLNLPPSLTDSQFLEICSQRLCDELRLAQGPGFQRVCLDSGGALQPLSLASAQNLGVLPRHGVPSLVDHMLPTNAAAATRRLLRRWLLAPRSSTAVSAMRELLRALLVDNRLVLPAFQRVPSLARAFAYITAQTASDRLFRDICSCCQDVQSVLRSPQCSAILSPLLVLVALEIGEDVVRPERLTKDLSKVTAHINSHLHDEKLPDEAHPAELASEDRAMQQALRRFLEANELFRGVASQQQQAVASAYEQVARARSTLCDALREAAVSLPRKAKDALVYNPFDNDLCFKAKPSAAVGAVDRRGKAKKDRYTTARLRKALSAYLAAARAADVAVQESLRELCLKLEPFMTSLRSAISLAELLVCARKHSLHAASCGWSLADISDGTEFNAAVTPYWLGEDGVSSPVVLDRRGAFVTGPNMSGKSTMMRAVGAATLLANCGFLSPCKGSVPSYRQVFFVASEGDRPSEGTSSFGQEALMSGILLKRACKGTLALIDEFGRGTEPSAATACVGALAEELIARDCHFVIATHLHAVADMELSLPRGRGRPQLWRMAVASGARSGLASPTPGWTYVLEQGVCRDSFAWVTLRQFGWPEESMTRFHRLLGTCKAGHHEEIEEAGESDAVLPAEPGAHEGAVNDEPLLAALCAVSGCAEEDAVCIGPGSSPPVPMCESVAVLYVLCLKDGRAYVGQTDHLEGRLKSHAVRFGAQLRQVLAVRVGTTAQARQLEARLQHQLLGAGVPLVSWHDSAHRHFGLGQGGSRAGPAEARAAGAEWAMAELPANLDSEAERLRETAAFLTRLADRLQS